MPSPVIRSFAKKTGKSVESVENAWGEAKKKVKESHPKMDEKRPSFWKMVTAITKKMIGIKESFDDIVSDILNEEMEWDDKTDDLYAKWKKLVNMSGSELEKFMDSEDGKVAGLSKKEASEAGISRGRDSARAIIRMKDKPKEKWNSTDVKWMKKQISFISRMSGMKGPLRDNEGKPTRKLLSLKIWGHDPEK